MNFIVGERGRRAIVQYPVVPSGHKSFTHKNLWIDNETLV